MKFRFFLLLVLFAAAHGATDPTDAAALRSLMSQWQNTPQNWGLNDPCDAPWDGVSCTNSRVTMLFLTTMGLKGTLSGDISQLTQLQLLDLSSNSGLGGPLPPGLGNLKQLNTLTVAGCSFIGNIPQELGNLANLTFLALNSNKFTGRIPASLGQLSKLYWLDIGDNQLSGPIPVSSSNSPGLDQLLNTKHFHFNKNQLGGTIPESLFSSKMSLIHVLFDSNNFLGPIPTSIGSLPNLQIIQLDGNSLSGPVPGSISNLTSLNVLSLANNQLTGPIPDLSQMRVLNYVDLSNNTFDANPAPSWFTSLESLTTLMVESGGLLGNIPPQMFAFPQIQVVLLGNNAFNGTLDLSKPGSELQTVDFRNNAISGFKSSATYDETLILAGNPVCTTQLANTIYCSLRQVVQQPYSTSLGQCNSTSCPNGESVEPQSCNCAYPYQGLLVFRAPSFRDVSSAATYQELEKSLSTQLNLAPNAVYISNPFYNILNYLEVQLKLFPSSGLYFTRLEILKIGLLFNNQTFSPPAKFGPYYFIASAYPFPSGSSGGGSSISSGLIAGIAVGCVILLIVLVLLGFYACRQKKRAERAAERSRPFASWLSHGKDGDGAPQLKGARLFSFDELKKCTNNFSEANEIGSGGYGKVYKGVLPSGEQVAIKKAQQGSMQGGNEFRTEIELLSRVHHKNLVGLVGFCFEQGEQMLVYEYIPNGTLRDSLVGRDGRHLDWPMRLRIALGSARGLAYLHELANPPIIHRDIKSTNILLDENITAKVADFGLSKLVSDSQKGHVSTQVKGTLGYLDPEYYMTQQLTEKSDVYSFGVVMLELITARQPIEKGKYIVREVRMALDERDTEYYGLRSLMDPRLRNTQNLAGFKRFVELAMKCVEESAASRPTMNELVKEFEQILQNEGIKSNSTSTTTSATEFVNTKGGAHPYNELLEGKDMNSDAFEYTGGYIFASRIEPK